MSKTLRFSRLWLLGAAFAVTALPALAQSASPASAPVAAHHEPLVPVFAPDPALLEAFGGKPGIFKLADLFVDKMKSDPRIGHYFKETKLSELKKNLGDQLCQVLAGPCVYEGDSMKASHGELKITKADSLAQIEILQASMDELQIPFGRQNELLARLAPMYRDIITR
jgi:hemoglobin